jgi:hypothetical protein
MNLKSKFFLIIRTRGSIGRLGTNK